MCDYSTEALLSRPAKAKDRLILDCLGENGCQGFIEEGHEDFPTPIVVCVPPGTELVIDQLPENLCQAWNVPGFVTAVLDHRTPDHESRYRDGLVIPGCVDGHISLQKLPLGMRATVERIPASANVATKAEPAFAT